MSGKIELNGPALVMVNLTEIIQRLGSLQLRLGIASSEYEKAVKEIGDIAMEGLTTAKQVVDWMRTLQDQGAEVPVTWTEFVHTRKKPDEI